MWFNIIKIKPFTGRKALKTRAKKIVMEYLSTVEIGHKFITRDILEFAQVNNLLEGVEHKITVSSFKWWLTQTIKVEIDSKVRLSNTSGSSTYVNGWKRVK
jgi:hypothetical protein